MLTVMDYTYQTRLMDLLIVFTPYGNERKLTAA